MADHCRIKRDAANQEIVMEVVNDAGVQQASFSVVSISLTDLGENRVAMFRAIPYKRASDCAWKQRYFLCTDEEDYTPP